jgi:hypothetical protein
MYISKLAKHLSKYLPVLAVLLATVIGLFVGRDLYPASSDSPSKTPAQFLARPDNPQPPILLGAPDPCGALIYTSLPPKCKTLDGEFMFVPGTSSIVVIPEGK